MNKPIFFMMVGLPASGKSCEAEKLSEIYDAKIHSSDKIRIEIANDVNCQDMNSKIFNILHKRVKADLRDGKSTIYDATNINYKRRKVFLDELKNIDCEKVCVFLATPYDKCIEQNTKRERTIPTEIIDKMYKNFYVPQNYEGWDDIYIVWNFDKTQYSKVKLFSELNNITQDNPHHSLTIGDHCIECYNILKKTGASHYIRQAGFYHDIGKNFCKSFKNSKGETTNIAHYYQHHLVSAYMALFYLKANISPSYLDYEILKIVNLIQWHMKPFMELETEKSIKKFISLVGEDFCNDLMTLHNADLQAHIVNI